jgi:hypothetical protein
VALAKPFIANQIRTICKKSIAQLYERRNIRFEADMPMRRLAADFFRTVVLDGKFRFEVI